jgi:hypothetical protein
MNAADTSRLSFGDVYSSTVEATISNSSEEGTRSTSNNSENKNIRKSPISSTDKNKVEDLNWKKIDGVSSRMLSVTRKMMTIPGRTSDNKNTSQSTPESLENDNSSKFASIEVLKQEAITAILAENMGKSLQLNKGINYYKISF